VLAKVQIILQTRQLTSSPTRQLASLPIRQLTS